MCIIIHAPVGENPSLEDIETMWENNPDGFGYAYLDSTSLTFEWEKWMPNDVEDVVTCMEALKDEDVVFHFRYRTVGDVTVDGCHPYVLLNSDDDVLDAVLFHNGTISMFDDVTGGMNDTEAFCENVLKPILKNNPYCVYEEWFTTLLESFGMSKFCIVLSCGTIIKSDTAMWKGKDGCFLSNSYSLTKDYRFKKSTVTPITKAKVTTAYTSLPKPKEDAADALYSWPYAQDSPVEDGTEMTEQGYFEMTDAERTNWVVNNPDVAKEFIDELLGLNWYPKSGVM